MGATGFFTHAECRAHDMGHGHPECPQRLSSIEDRLRATGVADVLACRDAPQASSADLELAHSRLHVAAMRGLHDELCDAIAAGDRCSRGRRVEIIGSTTGSARWSFVIAMKRAVCESAGYS